MATREVHVPTGKAIVGLELGQVDRLAVHYHPCV